MKYFTFTFYFLLLGILPSEFLRIREYRSISQISKCKICKIQEWLFRLFKEILDLFLPGHPQNAATFTLHLLFLDVAFTFKYLLLLFKKVTFTISNLPFTFSRRYFYFLDFTFFYKRLLCPTLVPDIRYYCKSKCHFLVLLSKTIFL